MRFLKQMFRIGLLLCAFAPLATAGCGASCCSGHGGILYCDSSAGRFVCRSGEYSTCYCTRHAIMDLQLIGGCCLWQGGVMATDETGLVICNNGGTSEICSLQAPEKTVASW